MDTTLLLASSFMSLSYLAVAFVITPANAPYLLAGYNTMSEEKRQAFDIECYLTDFFNFFQKTYPLSALVIVSPYGVS